MAREFVGRPRSGRGDADVSAFAAESGATDTAGLDALATYVKGQGLWDSFVIYPMKSAQNAGSGATVVYSLGGLTDNDITLVGSPTWASDGIDFNGTTQYGTASDFLGATSDLTVFARVKDQTEPVTSTPDMLLGQWVASSNDRSRILASYGSATGSEGKAAVLRSSDGIGFELYSASATTGAWSTDETRVGQWIHNGGRSTWLDKSAESLSLIAGSAKMTAVNASVDVSVMASADGVSPAAGTMVSAAIIESTITTAQRERITDLINAL